MTVTSVEEILNNKDSCLDGKTILISGVDSAYYPKKLISRIKDSGATDLTLVFIEGNTDLDHAGDPLDLIYNHQVKKVITSHLGNLSTVNFHDYVEEAEILPMGLLAQLVQAGANNIPGIAVSWESASLYRDEDFIFNHGTMINGQHLVIEPAIRGDFGLSVVDRIDPDTFNCAFDGTVYNNVDIVMASDISIVEYHAKSSVGFNESRIPGMFIDYAVQAGTSLAMKTNW